MIMCLNYNNYLLLIQTFSPWMLNGNTLQILIITFLKNSKKNKHMVLWSTLFIHTIVNQKVKSKNVISGCEDIAI